MKKHSSSVQKVYLQTIDQEIVNSLLQEVKASDFSCYGIETKSQIEKYDGVISTDTFFELKSIIEHFQRNNDVDDFFAKYYSKKSGLLISISTYQCLTVFYLQKG